MNEALVPRLEDGGLRPPDRSINGRGFADADLHASANNPKCDTKLNSLTHPIIYDGDIPDFPLEQSSQNLYIESISQ